MTGLMLSGGAAAGRAASGGRPPLECGPSTDLLALGAEAFGAMPDRAFAIGFTTGRVNACGRGIVGFSERESAVPCRGAVDEALAGALPTRGTTGFLWPSGRIIVGGFGTVGFGLLRTEADVLLEIVDEDETVRWGGPIPLILVATTASSWPRIDITLAATTALSAGFFATDETRGFSTLFVLFSGGAVADFDAGVAEIDGTLTGIVAEGLAIGGLRNAGDLLGEPGVGLSIEGSRTVGLADIKGRNS